MPTYFGDQWRANPEHDLSPQAQRDTFSRDAFSQDIFTYGERHNDKHIKAFVGVVLLVVMGFVLAALHPASHDMQASDAQTGTNQTHTQWQPRN